MENNGGGGSSYVPWIIAAIVAVLLYAKINAPTPSVDMYKLHINAQQSSRAEIERKELRRDWYGESPLSKDEMADISERNVLREHRKQTQ